MSSEDLNNFVSMRNQFCYSNKRADQNKRVGMEDFFHLLHEKLWVWCKFSTNLLREYLKVWWIFLSKMLSEYARWLGNSE